MSSTLPHSLVSNPSGKARNKYSNDEEDIQKTKEYLFKNDFRRAITAAFNLVDAGDSVYHAIASVTLEQVQQVIEAGGANGLHKWYVNSEGKSVRPVTPPGNPQALPNACPLPNRSYATHLQQTSKPTPPSSPPAPTSATWTLRAFPSPSARLRISTPTSTSGSGPARTSNGGGPTAQASLVRTSHAVLPIFMHHFGCVVPSYEALELIRQAARGRPVRDVGSGSGYWTFMLRRHGLEVRAVDDLQSTFRTMWIDDTVAEDGAAWLRKRGGAPDEVLLMV